MANRKRVFKSNAWTNGAHVVCVDDVILGIFGCALIRKYVAEQWTLDVGQHRLMVSGDMKLFYFWKGEKELFQSGTEAFLSQKGQG